MSRSVPEWRGRTDDAMPPPHVRARIFDRAGGVCHISGAKIQVGDAWHLDHIKRLADGGENRESNLAPALVEPHKIKTAEETRRGRLADRQRRKHIGAKASPPKPIQSRGFPVSEKQAAREKKSAKPALPPRAMFRPERPDKKQKPTVDPVKAKRSRK